jgi:rSAM/selenodomain-associated transferase 2
MRIAVIVPTLNEAEALGRLLPAAMAEADEVNISDGGSTDRSVAVARAHGAHVVQGPSGRGGQLNRGAAAAESDILVFLHADSTLPSGGLDAVRQAIGQGYLGGGFRVRFDVDRPLLGLGAYLINLRTLLTRCPLGDQAQFVTRQAFSELGGFRDWPILEDLDLIRRLKRRGRVAVLSLEVTTAARRFVTQGIARTVAINWLIWGLYFLGVSPHRLARLYRHIR